MGFYSLDKHIYGILDIPPTQWAALIDGHLSHHEVFAVFAQTQVSAGEQQDGFGLVLADHTPLLLPRAWSRWGWRRREVLSLRLMLMMRL